MFEENGSKWVHFFDPVNLEDVLDVFLPQIPRVRKSQAKKGKESYHGKLIFLIFLNSLIFPPRHAE